MGSHCVEQRNRTLYLLCAGILKAQIAFFEGGRGKLTALTQRSVAEKLGMNESTISRAVREKYLQCQWGLFPLQFFFSRGSIQTCPAAEAKNSPSEKAGGSRCGGGKGTDSDSGCGEDKKKPYSDRILAENSGKPGFSISRRTVAKYRGSDWNCRCIGKKGFRTEKHAVTCSEKGGGPAD